MTEPGDTPESVALRYVREELSTLRATMHDEMAAIRKDIMALSQEFRSQSHDLQPRVARLEERQDGTDRRLDNVEQQRSADRGLMARWWAPIIAAVVSGLLAAGLTVLLGG